MRIVFDIEANSLVHPTHIWVIVCKDIDSGAYHIFRKVTEDEVEKKRFQDFVNTVSLWVGHNILGYDLPHMDRLLGTKLANREACHFILDTLIISRLVDYPRNGHSIEDYGLEFEIEKSKFNNYKEYSLELEQRCLTDVDIGHKVYLKYLKYLSKEEHKSSILIEHKFQTIVNDIATNGFSFNTTKATSILNTVETNIATLDLEILKEFPSKEVLIREFTPKLTKFGTISKTSVPRALWDNIPDYEAGLPYRYTKMVPFNPSSHKQLIEVLHEAGWQPIDKTQGHIDTERELTRLKRSREPVNPVDIQVLSAKMDVLSKSGWKINEQNLATLPKSAPASARTLATRILLESRRRTLTEWLSLVCIEIKIENESIEALGRVINEEMILRGAPRNKNITDKDVEKEILKSLENLYCKSLNIFPKKSVSEDIILNQITNLLSKTLIEWLKNKKVSVLSAEENKSFVSITLMVPGRSEVSSVKDVIPHLDGLKSAGLKYSIISERIKGKPQAIGTWTHRMACQKPNMQNIPNEFELDGSTKLLGKELRQLWQAPRNRLLVGVDAEGIQLRIFAHYIEDEEFTDALVRGVKAKKTDPHSLNQRILGSVCKSRAAAKRFVYALLLGGGIGKLAQILECSIPEAQEALDRLLQRYTGFATLKEKVIPSDAKKGYFIGLDSRKVRIPGESLGERKHLCMSGYLQNGEAVCMKYATVEWHQRLMEEEFLKQFPRLKWLLVNMVHDEWQTEVNNNIDLALIVAKTQADALITVGEKLGLKCPLAGSYYNDDHHEHTIGTTWYKTH